METRFDMVRLGLVYPGFCDIFHAMLQQHKEVLRYDEWSVRHRGVLTTPSPGPDSGHNRVLFTTLASELWLWLYWVWPKIGPGDELHISAAACSISDIALTRHLEYYKWCNFCLAQWSSVATAKSDIFWTCEPSRSVSVAQILGLLLDYRSLVSRHAIN